MELKIVGMTISNFKGIKKKEISFDGNNAKLIGENATGKTTCADAWFWTFSDTNYALVKNPPVTPLGESECESRVEINLALDSTPLTVAKTQKFKSKETDGKTTTSVTNGYEINSVEKSYTNFVSDLKERGINMDDFLFLSNVFAFSADTSKQGREKMRNKLFEMGEGITDLDIAKTIDVPTVTENLEKGYKVEEIEKKAKSSLKAIKDKYGLNNEVINAKIEGMLSSRAIVDKTALEAKKTALESDIAQYKDGLSRISDTKAEKEVEVARLNDKIGQIIKDANTDIDRQKRDLESRLELLEHQRTIFCADYDLSAREINRTTSEIALSEEHLSNWRDLYKKVQDETLDDKDLKCPTCGVEYSADRIAEIKENFESSKNERLNSYKARGEETKKNIEKLNAERDKAKEKHSDLHKEIAELNMKKDKVKTEIAQLPLAVMRTDETDSIDAEIEKIRAEIAKDDSVILEETKAIIREKEAELQEVIGQLAVGERNSEIDKKVEELREERKQAEINRAMAEKTINEVEVFKRRKNEALSEEINSHFKIAQFRLFKVLKNGSIEDDCAILVGGKELNSQLNQSTQVLALCDIVAGLQKFDNQFIPVFLDNHALFTSETDKKIPLECQVIKLVATEGIKELQIQKGE